MGTPTLSTPTSSPRRTRNVHRVIFRHPLLWGMSVNNCVTTARRNKNVPFGRVVSIGTPSEPTKYKSTGVPVPMYQPTKSKLARTNFVWPAFLSLVRVIVFLISRIRSSIVVRCIVLFYIMSCHVMSYHCILYLCLE